MTLDETYARTLGQIDEQNWEYAHRLFQCVAAATRPLQTEELAEFLAFDFDAGSIPTFLADWRPEDPENEVLSICSTLLLVVKPESGSPVIQFAHFSVKEYLTSARLAESNSPISRFHVSMASAHAIVAEACLGFLLHFDENITGDRLDDFPLKEYASGYWMDHVRFENVPSSVQDGMKRLFDPSKCHLTVWVWIFDPQIIAWRRRSRSSQPERLSQANATPLHYAAIYNLHEIATFLIVEHSQDINARGFDQKETPLHAASRRGHVETVRVLLRQGADTEARDNDGESPLFRAVQWGHVELAQVLLEHGADANAQDKTGRTPLHRTSFFRKPAVAQVLLSHGADVSAQDEFNETPLHHVEDEEVARLLLEHGADANALDVKNQTPLHHVSENGRAGAARVLLEHGVDANARNVNNETPLHLASSPNSYRMPKGIPDVGRLLLQYGADIHARDDEGRTPFMRATAKSHHRIMPLLLEHGAEDHRV